MRRRRRRDRGAGLVATMFGVPLVLVLILFAAQVLLRLQAASTVRSLAGDAVRDVAIDPGPMRPATARAGRTLRDRLGPAGATADIDWGTTADGVTLRVRIAAPRILPLVGLGPLADPITASTSTRWERWA